MGVMGSHPVAIYWRNWRPVKMTCYAGAGRSCRPTRKARASHGTDRQRGSAHHPSARSVATSISNSSPPAPCYCCRSTYTGALFSSGDAHFAQGTEKAVARR